ncbi:hypothetical protein Hanom_Chr16g01472511 [Helianthus anomalus]
MLEDDKTSKELDSDKEFCNSEEGYGSSNEEDDESEVRSDNEMEEPTGVHELERPESLPPASDNEQAEGFNKGGVPDFAFFGTTRSLDGDPFSEEGGNPTRTGGDHGNSGLVSELNHIFNNNNFNMGRPTISSRIRRPRQKKSSCSANVSPISDPRPRKRFREDSEFSFDLNKKVDEGLSRRSRLLSSGRIS